MHDVWEKLSEYKLITYQINILSVTLSSGVAKGRPGCACAHPILSAYST